MFFNKQNQRISELERDVENLKTQFWNLSNELDELKTKKGKGKK